MYYVTVTGMQQLTSAHILARVDSIKQRPLRLGTPYRLYIVRPTIAPVRHGRYMQVTIRSEGKLQEVNFPITISIRILYLHDHVPPSHHHTW